MIKRIDLEPSKEIITASLKDGTFIRMEDVHNFLSLLKDTEPPYVWCIDASWGDGKTFFVKAIQTILECNNPWIKQSSSLQILEQSLDKNLKVEGGEFVPIYFNAWENDSFDSPLCALAASIAADYDESFKSNSISITEIAAAIIDTAAGAYGLNLDIKELKNKLTGEDFINDIKKRRELENRINELIKAICAKNATKAVLFIDELDRCRPEFAIKLLSDIKSLFTNKQLIIVYSMDVTQLSNALKGFYGSSFDPQKYLERFYDRRIGFSPVSKKDYLLRTNPPLRGSGIYDEIVNALIDARHLTMRDLNRLAKFNEARGFLDTQHSEGTIYDYVISFANLALLPVLIAIEYFEPKTWHQIQSGESFESIFTFAKDILPFEEMLDRVLPSVFEVNETISDEDRSNLIVNLCSLIFLPSNNFSERKAKALEILGCNIDEKINKEVFRTLNFSKWQ